MANLQLHDFCDITKDCLLVYKGAITTLLLNKILSKQDASNY
jgi:hypothetical protein